MKPTEITTKALAQIVALQQKQVAKGGKLTARETEQMTAWRKAASLGQSSRFVLCSSFIYSIVSLKYHRKTQRSPLIELDSEDEENFDRRPVQRPQSKKGRKKRSRKESDSEERESSEREDTPKPAKKRKTTEPKEQKRPTAAEIKKTEKEKQQKMAQEKREKAAAAAKQRVGQSAKKASGKAGAVNSQSVAKPAARKGKPNKEVIATKRDQALLLKQEQERKKKTLQPSKQLPSHPIIEVPPAHTIN